MTNSVFPHADNTEGSSLTACKKRENREKEIFAVYARITY